MLTDSLERTAGLCARDDRSAALLLMLRVDSAAATAWPTPDPDELRARFSGLHPLADRALEHAPRSTTATSSPRPPPPRGAGAG